MDQLGEKRKAKKTRDLILILAILAIAGILFLVFFLRNKNTVADRVIVRVDGKVVYSEPLSVDKDMDIAGYAGGHNFIRVQGSKVKMLDADCPDKVCVHTGTIDKVGQTIVCLPHKLVVEISGSNSSDLDSIVR